jgi:uncharacterized protein (DUF1015 family)
MLVSGFKALHYNPQQIKDLSRVITPPYDVISPEEADRFRASSPYNFCHVDMLGPGEGNYAQAAERLAKWRQSNTLSQDPYSSYYLYQQTFEINGKKHTRRTLICSVELHEFSDRIIRPHENTHGKHKADRLDQLRHLQANLSHIFGMVKDPDGFLSNHFETWMFHAPFLRTVDAMGTEHVLWREEETKAGNISAFFQERPIYIVDGHHRYESAVAYAKEVGALGNPSHPASRTMFSIANCYDPGLIVLPTHRKAKHVSPTHLTREKVEESFELNPCTFEELQTFMKTPPKTPDFGLFAWGQLFLATPREWREAEDSLGTSLARLPVYWSDELLLKTLAGIPETERSQRIEYEKSAGALWDKKTDHDFIVFHATPSVDWVTDIADEGKFMPQKSTYFYPKLFAGLTLRDLK